MGVKEPATVADGVVEVRWELALLLGLCLYFTYFPLLPHIGWSMRGRSILPLASPFCFCKALV